MLDLRKINMLMCGYEEEMKMATKKKTENETAAVTAPVKEKATKAKTSKSKATSQTTEAKAKKATCKTSVCVEMNGLSVAIADIQNAAKKAVKEKGLEATELKIYINAAEQAAYYTVNGEGGKDYKVDLKTL